MERDVKYMTVGAVVCAAIIGFIIFTTWILGGLDKNTYARYSIFFYDAVSGLNINSPVEYKGVRVGQVVAIDLDADHPERVRVDIEVKEDTPVRKQTRVKMNLQGITGLSGIELETNKNSAELPELTEEAPYPILVGDGRQLTKLMNSMPQIATNILEITEKINGMMDEQTSDDIRLLVQSVSRMSQKMDLMFSDQNIAHLNTIFENTAAASDDISGISDSFRQTARKFEEVAATLGEVVENNQESLSKFTQQGLDQLLALTRESRAMAKEIRKLAATLSEDPSRILYKPQANGVDIRP